MRAFEFVPDRAGAGKHRGGAPYRRSYRFLETDGVLQVRSDRAAVRPYGLYGGRAGRPSRNVLIRDGQHEDLPSKLLLNLREGDVFSHELPGGGGWGDPLERDPRAVLADVRNGFVSVDSARDEYGVVVGADPLEVDMAATDALRTERAGSGNAAISWE